MSVPDRGATSRDATSPITGRSLVLAAASRRAYRRHEKLARQGDAAGALYVIESGHVAIKMMSSSGTGVILTVIGAGEVVGEVGLLLPDNRRTATIEAVDQVVAHTLTNDRLQLLRASHPQVDDFLLEVLAHRVDRLSRQLFEAQHLPVDKRLARRLLDVGRLFVDDPLPIIVALTQDEIAQLVGTTRPTINHFLKRLAGDGCVRVVRGRVEILDVAQLRLRAQ